MTESSNTSTPPRASTIQPSTQIPWRYYAMAMLVVVVGLVCAYIQGGKFAAGFSTGILCGVLIFGNIALSERRK